MNVIIETIIVLIITSYGYEIVNHIHQHNLEL